MCKITLPPPNATTTTSSSNNNRTTTTGNTTNNNNTNGTATTTNRNRKMNANNNCAGTTSNGSNNNNYNGLFSNNNRLLLQRKHRRHNNSQRPKLLPSILLGLVAACFLSFYSLFNLNQDNNGSNNNFPGNNNNPIQSALSSYNNTIIKMAATDAANNNMNKLGAPAAAAAAVQQQEERKILTTETKQEIIDRLYPTEDPIPNIEPPADGYDTFSACMLVMDDNHRLTEWLAYHYHVLPLRYLIVAVDPRSKTRPTHVLNLWRERGMYIIEWDDKDFWRTDLREIPIDAELQMKRDRHRGRQKYFYKQCMIYLKEQNRTWVALHDSDEYLVYNHAGREKFHKWQEARKSTQNKRLQPSQIPPTTAEEGAMIKYIRQEQDAGLNYYQSPCIGIPRLMFGAMKPEDIKTIQKDIPNELHNIVSQLDTIYYRQHARRNDFAKNALGKVIIDVSRVDVKNSPYFMSLHRPIKSICGPPWHNDWDSGLRINHYLGSWESYSFRDDSRRGLERSWEQWEYKASTLGEQNDDNIRPWISGFVDKHGIDEVTKILSTAGLPTHYKHKATSDWRMQPDKILEILNATETETNDLKRTAFEDWIREKYNGLSTEDEILNINVQDDLRRRHVRRF